MLRLYLGITLAIAAASAPAAAEPWTLERAIDRAVDVSERVDAATARREAASARVDRGRAALFGDVTASGAATRRAREVTREVGGAEVTLQNAYALAAQLSASLPLVDLRARAGLSSLRLERDAARLDEAEIRRQVSLEVAAIYLAALGAEQVVAAAERRAEYARARLSDAEARAGAGLASKSDATGAELELATAERERATAIADLGVAYQELAYLVDAPVEGPLVIPTDLLAAASAGDVDPRRRLDLEAADLRVRAASEAADVPRAGWWPTLDLAGLATVNNEPGFTGEYWSWSVALVATWNLWDGGSRRAETRELEATARAEAADAAALRRAAATEVAVARTRLEGARAALVAAERAADAAGRYAEEVAILYAQGLTRALEVIDAGARRFDAEVALARARFTVGVAYLEELGASGGTLEPAR